MAKAILAMAIISAILISGCIGLPGQQDADSTTSTGGDSGQAISGGSDGTSGNDGVIGGAASAFTEALGKRPAFFATYAANYSPTDNIIYTVYLQGENFRMDTEYEGEPLNYTSKTWTLQGKEYSCIQVEGEEEFCLDDSSDTENGGYGNFFTDSEAYAARENTGLYSVTRLPGRTIAGETGICERVSSRSGYNLADICFTYDGILLYSKFSPNDAETIATSISRTVPESVFNPPEITGFPEFNFPTAYD